MVSVCFWLLLNGRQITLSLSSAIRSLAVPRLWRNQKTGKTTVNFTVSVWMCYPSLNEGSARGFSKICGYFLLKIIRVFIQNFLETVYLDSRHSNFKRKFNFCNILVKFLSLFSPRLYCWGQEGQKNYKTETKRERLEKMWAGVWCSLLNRQRLEKRRTLQLERPRELCLQ